MIPGSSEITEKNGAIIRDSANGTAVTDGINEGAEEITFTVETNTYNGLKTQTVTVTPEMLTTADGKAIDTTKSGVYSNLTLTYEGEVVCTDFTLKVYDKFTVEFKNYDGTVLSTQTVIEGQAATAPEAPERAADVEYIYTFAGWDKEFSNITEDTTVTALYTSEAQVYYSRGDFNNWETTDVLTRGEDGLYRIELTLDAGTYGYKAANSDYSNEWPYGNNATLTLEDQSKVTFVLDTAANTITTEIETLVKRFTVTFVNADGTVLSTQHIKEGEDAVAPSETPTLKPDVEYIYTFSGWDKDFTNITEDTTVTAQYSTTEQVYYLRGSFNGWMAIDKMTKGENGIYTFETTLDAGTYEYKAANSDYSMEWPLGTNKSITLEKESIVTFTLDTINHTLIASGTEVIKEYSVVFKSWDGTMLSNQTVTEGGSAVEPSTPYKTPDVEYKYVFAGWDKPFDNITEDTVVTAIFTEEPQVYYIRGDFNNWDTSNVMTKGENGIHTVTLTLNKGHYEYKAANDDWSMNWPYGSNQTITLNKDSFVTFTLDTINHTLTTEVEEIIKFYTVTFVDYTNSSGRDSSYSSRDSHKRRRCSVQLHLRRLGCFIRFNYSRHHSYGSI